MGVIVSFDYNSWIARYPEFTAISEATAQMYFNEATIYCRNDGGGPVRTANVQSTLLNMLTAHIAFLNASLAADPDKAQIVGRISSAGEGSVNLGTENSFPPGTSQWYQQSRYGSAFWEATKPYRTMRYLPGRTRNMNPRWPFSPGWPGWPGM